MAKMIAFSQDAREAIRRGVGKLTKAVRSTLGPCGHTVLLAKSFGPPTVTKDGVTVAKEIDLEDPYENIGAKMVREVASKTNDVAGDGTTTATVLADAIFNEGLRAVVAGVNPVYLKNGIERAVSDVVGKLKANSIQAHRFQDEGHTNRVLYGVRIERAKLQGWMWKLGDHEGKYYESTGHLAVFSLDVSD